MTRKDLMLGKMIAVSVACIILISCNSLAEDDSATIGPYDISFDLGIPHSSYGVLTEAPEKTGDDKVTTYDITIKNEEVKGQLIKISISEYKKEQFFGTDNVQSLKSTLSKDPDIKNIEIVPSTIDGANGSIASYEMSISGSYRKLYSALYHPTFDPNRVLVLIISSYPWDGGTEQLINTLHITKSIAFIIPVTGQRNASDWVDQSVALIKQSKYDEAIQACDKAIELEPEYAMPWNNKGSALAVQGKYNESIPAYDKAIELDPKFAWPWNNKGSSLASQGKYNESIPAYDKAIELDPKYAMAWNNKAISLNYLGKYNDALKAYEEAIRLDPDLSSAWNDKAWILYVLGEYDESLKAANKSIELDPEFAMPWNNKGLAFASQGKYNESIQAYNRAIELDRNFALPWSNKGVALCRQGNYAEAIKAYDEAIRLDPDLASVWDNKGEALRMQGKHDEAILALDKALELDPKLADAWNNKGEALKALGRSEESNAALNKAKELGYNNSVSEQSLVLKTNCTQSNLIAIDEFEPAASSRDSGNEKISTIPGAELSSDRTDAGISTQEDSHDRAIAFLNHGNELYNQGKYDEAIDAYDRSIELDPQNPEAWQGKGYALNKLGRNTEANECFWKATGLNAGYANDRKRWVYDSQSKEMKLKGTTMDAALELARSKTSSNTVALNPYT
ncbi:MAG: tetratricopeptide repeat protein [Methanothrix sp.]